MNLSVNSQCLYLYIPTSTISRSRFVNTVFVLFCGKKITKKHWGKTDGNHQFDSKCKENDEMCPKTFTPFTTSGLFFPFLVSEDK